MLFNRQVVVQVDSVAGVRVVSDDVARTLKHPLGGEETFDAHRSPRVDPGRADANFCACERRKQGGTQSDSFLIRI